MAVLSTIVRRWATEAPVDLAEQLFRFSKQVSDSLAALDRYTPRARTVAADTTALPGEVIFAIGACEVTLADGTPTDVGRTVTVRHISGGNVSVNVISGTALAGALDGTTGDTARTWTWSGSAWYVTGAV